MCAGVSVKKRTFSNLFFIIVNVESVKWFLSAEGKLNKITAQWSVTLNIKNKIKFGNRTHTFELFIALVRDGYVLYSKYETILNNKIWILMFKTVSNENLAENSFIQLNGRNIKIVQWWKILISDVLKI